MIQVRRTVVYSGVYRETLLIESLFLVHFSTRLCFINHNLVIYVLFGSCLSFLSVATLFIDESEKFSY